MIELKNGAGLVVAADVQNAFATLDDALLSEARMMVSVLEATEKASICAGQKQRLLSSLGAGMAATLDGRGHVVSALKELLDIKSQSNLAPVNYGCPGGWVTAEGETAPRSAKSFATA
jgi:hypothetical protein